MNQKVASRPFEEKHFHTFDGVELYYRYWPASCDQPKGAIVLFHRGHEHSGRLTHIVEELEMLDYACFAWDARGHGQSPGPRGFSPSFAASIRDVQTFMQHIREKHGFSEDKTAVIGQSVAAVLLSAWAHDYAPHIRCMVLASPAFKIKLYVPFARMALALWHRIRGDYFINSYVKPKFLTHDPDRVASYQTDKLITRAISANVLLDLYQTSQRIVEDAAAITVPTQLFISDRDWVVHKGPQHRFYERLGCLFKERHVLPGFYHDTFGEKDRKPVLQKIRTYLLNRFDEPISRPSLIHADQLGYTRQEADTLATPLSKLSLRGLYWASTRFGLKMGGLLSKGIRLGHQTGFDSGSTLDYVYRNKPEGFPVIGTMVDKVYLNAIGWRGIRQRKLNAEELLRHASQLLRKRGQKVHVLDVAAGHGRYILEAISQEDAKPDSILLRDYSDLNVKHGTQLIADKGLDGIARFVNANAFDPQTYSNFDPQPNIGVVSGLYELFAENEVIRESLSGFSQALHQGAYLIYTCQPWHPQLEMIARALTSHRQGQAWIMRRRTQEEMDQLVREAGFRKMTQRIDEHGIFTVSLAVKV